MSTKLWQRVDPARFGSLVIAAVVTGVLAGLVAATFASIAGEPAIDDAIAIEEANAAAHPAAEEDHGEEEASVSRSDQRGVGLFGAYALTGAAFGGLLALTTHGLRRGRPDVARRVVTAGLILAGGLTVAPWIKYPPNPPAVGDPDTLVERQWLYVGIICIAVLVGLAAVTLSQRLRSRGWPEHRRVAAVAATVAVIMLVAFTLMPGAPDEVPVGATLVWRFRLASLGSNLTLWAVLTLAVAWVLAEATRRRVGEGSGPERPLARSGA